jgi:hypothetical protein
MLFVIWITLVISFYLLIAVLDGIYKQLKLIAEALKRTRSLPPARTSPQRRNQQTDTRKEQTK